MTKKHDVSVKLGKVSLENPLIAASGCFGFGEELKHYVPATSFGAVVTKAFSLKPRAGNPPIRVAECEAGMLNAIGLQNPGLDIVLSKELPNLQAQNATIIANIAGESEQEYIELCQVLDKEEAVVAVELNLSCPNVKAGCMSFGTEPEMITRLTRACRAVTTKDLWVKLTPNVSDIVSCALAAEEGGASAISMINTLLGMLVDIKTRRPVLRNNTGGYSGPAIKPVALRMVQQTYQAVSIPIVGMGGISSAEDVIAFVMAGATAVQIGTALLVDPYISVKINKELNLLLDDLGEDKLSDLTGTLQLW